MPNIDKPNRSGNKRERIPQGVRFDVFRRDNFTCVYCGGQSPDVVLECDHKVAIANGGIDAMSNLVTAWYDCNRGKSAKVVDIGERRARKADASLTGCFGHSLTDDGALLWQFEITGRVDDDRYTVQLFSWLDGRPTKVEILSGEELAKCNIYGTEEEWIRQAELATGRRA